jgi:hypothetical protein
MAEPMRIFDFMWGPRRKVGIGVRFGAPKFIFILKTCEAVRAADLCSSHSKSQTTV